MAARRCRKDGCRSETVRINHAPAAPAAPAWYGHTGLTGHCMNHTAIILAAFPLRKYFKESLTPGFYD